MNQTKSQFLKLYKVPFLIAITLTVVLIALMLERQFMVFALIAVGAIFGVFLLDLDYFIHAFLTEKDQDFSKTFSAYVKHWNLGQALTYAHYHKNDIKEKTLNSAFFQVILIGLTIFTIFSQQNIFILTLVLSAFVNSIYRMIEAYYQDNDLKEWFWVLKETPSSRGIYVYTAGLLLFLVCALAIIG